MKPQLSWIVLLLTVIVLQRCRGSDPNDNPETVLNERVVEASCGQCQFGLDGDGCDLAVRVGGEYYFVDGTTIDDHGDAHASDGFCNNVRHARIQATLKDGRAHVTSLELLPATQ